MKVSGGLTREFFTLLSKGMSEIYLERTGVFRHNSIALQVLTCTCTSTTEAIKIKDIASAINS